MSYGALSFAAAVRVVVGVHDRAADGGTDSEVSRFTRFTYAHDFVLEVAYLTYGCLTLQRNESHFAGRHLYSCVSAFFCHNLGGNACRTRDLRAPAGLKLDCMDYGTYGDIGKAQSVARFDIRACAGQHLVAYRKTNGRENVSLFAVGVSEKRDVSRTVGIVLNGLNRCGNAVFIALEIYNSVFDAVSSANVANGILP